MRWAENTLLELTGDVEGAIQTGPFGSQLHAHDYVEHGTPVVMPQDIVSDTISSQKIARVDERMVAKLTRHILEVGDIIYPRRGDLNKRAIVRPEHAGWLCGTGCVRVRVHPEVLDSTYVFYYLKLPHVVRFIENKAVGATMLNLSTSVLESVLVRYPSLDDQKRIADILSAYDDLIENNNRRMALLEEAIHLLYREWFVYLRFPGHERVKVVDGVPEGWKRVTLMDLATLNYGKSLPERIREDGPYPVYGSSGEVGTHKEALVKGPGLVVGRKGNVGTVFFSDSDFFPIDTVYYVDQEQTTLFLYACLKSQTFVSSDAAVPGLNRNHAYSKELVLPPSLLRGEFETYATEYWRHLTTLRRQNQRLREARDLLLPRLLNGSIAV